MTAGDPPEDPRFPPKYASAAAIIRDTDGRILIVNPTYKEGWELPGGIVEANESPRDGCARELREEIGLDISVGRMLVADYSDRARMEGLHFVFNGGRLSETEISAITLAEEELSEFAFVDLAEAKRRLVLGSSLRAPQAVAALEDGRARYLERGEPRG